MKVQYVCTEEEPVQAAPVVSGIKQTKLDFESSDTSSTRATRSIRLWSAVNEFAHAASRAVAEQLRKPTTRCFSMAAWAWQDTLDARIGHTIKKRKSGHAAELRQRGKVHHRSDQLAAFLTA